MVCIMLNILYLKDLDIIFLYNSVILIVTISIVLLPTGKPKKKKYIHM